MNNEERELLVRSLMYTIEQAVIHWYNDYLPTFSTKELLEVTYLAADRYTQAVREDDETVGPESQ